MNKIILAIFLLITLSLPVDAFDYNNYTKYVVSINTVHDKYVSCGNGFFIASGLILTNKHIVEHKKGDIIVIRTSDNDYLVGTEVKEYKDLALIKVGKKTPFLYLSNNLNKKDAVHIVSYFNNNYLSQNGNFLDKKASKWGGNEYDNALRLSNYATFGYSGSPVLNDNGEVIGVLSSACRLYFDLLGNKVSVFINSYAISTDDVLKFLQR